MRTHWKWRRSTPDISPHPKINRALISLKTWLLDFITRGSFLSGMASILFLSRSILNLSSSPQHATAERAFTSDDQLAFAKLSGDHNPVHVNPVMARRLLFGQQIVHGLHAVLWSADECLRTRMQGLELRTVKANFQAGIGIGQAVNCICIDQNEDQIEIRLEIEKTPAMWIQIAWSPSRQHPAETLQTAPCAPGKCRERSFEEAAG
ncbi:MAG: hypothetical protein EHM37_14315, partial [Deltaproteobacteria bacterium]